MRVKEVEQSDNMGCGGKRNDRSTAIVLSREINNMVHLTQTHTSHEFRTSELPENLSFDGYGLNIHKGILFIPNDIHNEIKTQSWRLQDKQLGP